MAKSKPIRDPVHNYISTTSIEITIIDSPEFQRLRFILQNASAYLTYPSSTNNRFLHSLGVMHLSGLLFVNALRNTDAKTFINYLRKCDETLKKYERDLGFDTNVHTQQWQKLLGNMSQFSHDPFCGNRVSFICEDNEQQYSYYIASDDGESREQVHHNPYYIINTLWQSLRLVALMHDVGHLPMSHLFEKAIDDCMVYGRSDLRKTIESEILKRKEKYENTISHSIEKKDEFNERIDAKSLPIHELRGLTIFEKYYRPDPKNASAVYIALVYRIAKDIFLLQTVISEKHCEIPRGNYFNPLRCLHGIISGELDADRLDYCLRDPKSSGLEYGAIDVKRILDNILLHEENERFFIAPTDKSLSAIEAFFHQRYLTYQYLIYHHNVVRSDGVLMEIIFRLIDQAYRVTEQNQSLRDLLNRSNFVKSTIDKKTGCRLLSDTYSHTFDDAWLRTLFSEVFVLLDTITKNNNKERKPTDQWIKHLHLLIDTFLYRKTNNLFSIWKRPTDFQKTYQKIASILDVSVDTIIAKKPLTLPEGKSSKKEHLIKAVEDIKEKIEREHDVIIIHRYLEPKIFRYTPKVGKEYLRMLISDPEKSGWTCSYIGDASPYIKSLIETALGTPNYHISFVGESIKNKSELMEKCIDNVVKVLADYCKKI